MRDPAANEAVDNVLRYTKFTMAISLIGGALGAACGYSMAGLNWVVLFGWLGLVVGGTVGALIDFPRHTIFGGAIGATAGAVILVCGAGAADVLVRLIISGMVAGAVFGGFRLLWQQG